MQVVRTYQDVSPTIRGGAVAIGNFDGVHRGHRVVIDAARTAAATHDCPAGVVCFSPHPRRFFAPHAPLFQLTDEAQKLAQFAALGLDFTAVLTFNAALASLTADQFVDDVLVGGLGVKAVVIGYDFHFGKGRAGSPDFLRAAGDDRGFEVHVVAPAKAEGTVFSSSSVRAFLRDGDVARAAEVLARPYAVRGVVARGDGRGTGLGFPTANIAMPEGADLLPGIYAVRVQIVGRPERGTIDGAAYLGTRPTFQGEDVRLETFLFDFDGSLYGDEIEVAFVDFIRGDKAFESGEALAAQMEKDCAAARDVLRHRSPVGVVG
ncbi:MAG: bifunctional riboflavin kinase/FAD synthetase [Pseudomonadota bacterium]